jgi:hypothetical protein
MRPSLLKHRNSDGVSPPSVLPGDRVGNLKPRTAGPTGSAGGGIRTLTPLRATGFKPASVYRSTTPAGRFNQLTSPKRPAFAPALGSTRADADGPAGTVDNDRSAVRQGAQRHRWRMWAGRPRSCRRPLLGTAAFGRRSVFRGHGFGRHTAFGRRGAPSVEILFLTAHSLSAGQRNRDWGRYATQTPPLASKSTASVRLGTRPPQSGAKPALAASPPTAWSTRSSARGRRRGWRGPSRARSPRP